MADAADAPPAPVDFRQLAPDLQRKGLTDNPGDAWLVSRLSVSRAQRMAVHLSPSSNQPQPALS